MLRSTPCLVALALVGLGYGCSPIGFIAGGVVALSDDGDGGEGGGQNVQRPVRRHLPQWKNWINPLAPIQMMTAMTIMIGTVNAQ